MLLVAVLAGAVVSGCTDEPTARRVLTEQGYRDVEITGYAVGCHRDDVFSTGFRAVAPSGRVVTGAVCGSALLSTIRIR